MTNLNTPSTSRDVLSFWFEAHSQEDWYARNDDFDAAIRERFGALWASAARGELFDWRKSSAGRLAEIIVLDQFSRNLYRASSRAFSCDAMALALAQEAIAGGADRAIADISRQMFFYMPFMHSESAVIHQEAVKLFSIPGLEDNLQYEYAHQRIVERFGRYPHRNAALGRESTAEEIAFLQEPGASF